MPQDQTETGWLADLTYHEGEFHSGLALFAGPAGNTARFSRDAQDLARATRLPGRALLPGLVNVHSHTFQRVIRGRTEHRTSAERDTFWTWRQAMYHAANLLTPEDIYAAARMAFLEMVLSGITTVGEFHYLHHDPGGVPYEDRNLLAHQVLRAASEVGLRIALLRTGYVRAGWGRPPDPGQARFITPNPEDFIEDTIQLQASHDWVGVAPHSVRAVPLDYLRDIVAFARTRSLPVHMHIAEQPAEVEACLGEYGLRPVQLLDREGILDSKFTGIHAIHVNQDEVRYLGRAKTKVCACPTSERNLGDGAVPADLLGVAGAAICFGSDSNVQIDLLEDARELEYHLRMEKLERAVLAGEPGREALARRLFMCASVQGAASLSPGSGTSLADFFTVNLNDPSLAGADAGSLLSHIVFSLERTAIRDVCIRGKLIVEEGKHPLQDRIVEDFNLLQRRIWS